MLIESMKNDSGMCYGLTVTPFLSYSDGTNLKKELPKTTSATKVARCLNCSAYLNPFCEASTVRWICSICGTRNVFPKSMLRYRQADLNMLPEMQNLMVDYPLPLPGNDCDTSQEKYACPASARPLVHVFLVQESMSLDCIQATIQAMETMSHAIHPDVEIILLTFSNRIGVYRLHGQSSKSVCVQYLHFVSHSLNENENLVLDGQENTSSLCSSSSSTQSPSTHYISPLLSLNEVALFGDTCLPAAVSRKPFLYALESLHDASPSASSSPGALCGPLVMLGPVLDEVISWICDTDSIIPPSAEQSSENYSSIGGLAGLLAGLGITSPITENSQSSDLYKGWNVGISGQRNTSGIDFCSGVELHLVVSTPQDLCYGCHLSVAESGRLDSQWVQKIALKASTRGLGINIWGLADFDASLIGLSELAPLAEFTGGKISRFVLGTDPAAERRRFAADLTRYVTSQVASKCMMKLRSSALVNEKSSKMLGFGIIDESMPGIYKVASCRCHNTFAYLFQMQNEITESFQAPPSAKLSSNLIVQIAFSYNTLVEADDCRGRRSSRTESIDEPLEPDSKNRATRSNSSSSELHQNSALNRVNLSFIVDKEEEDSGYEYDAEHLKQCSSSLELSSLYEEHMLYRSKKIQKNIKMDTPSTRYNHRSRLVAVRRLRVITCMIETTQKVPRLLRCVHVPTMFLLLLRDSLMQRYHSLKILKNYVFTTLTSVCQMIYLHRFQASRVEEASQFDQITQDMALQIINEAVAIPQISRFLQLYFAALNVLHITDTGSPNDESKSDIFTELASLLMSCDSYSSERLLYPEFREIRPDMIVNCDKSLRLRRESVITSGKSLFLVDSIRQIVLYRSLATQITEPSSPSYKQDELSSPEKYLVDPQDPPHLRNTSWIMNDLSRRLKVNPQIPKIILSEAGKLSSGFFSELLIEDCSLIPGGYQAFHERLVLDLVDQLVTVPPAP